MKRYTVEITRSATEDLRGIFRYIRDAFSAPDTALEQFGRIGAGISGLAHSPERFALLPKELFPNMNIRRMPIDNYLVFYSVDQEALRVNVLRVLYTRRDWAAILNTEQALL